METWSRAFDLNLLADRHGTPTYLLHAPTLRDNVAAYLELVDDPARLLYPVKTNPAMAVLRRLAALGCGMDCASRDEVESARLAGVPMARISYNTPAPEFGLIRSLLRCGATVVLDSEEMVRRLDQRVPAEQIHGSVLLRVNIDEPSDYLQHFQWQELVHHGSRVSKFGIPIECVVDLLLDVKMPVSGLHMHVGTMMDNLEAFEVMVHGLHRLVDAVHAKTNHRITLLNLGGGLGIPFLPGQSFPSISDLVGRLAPLRRPELRYSVEPGQSLVGEAIGLLTRIVALKTMRDRRWAIVDVGSDQLIKITTVSWYHQIVDAQHRPLPLEGPDAIGGPLCFAGDTLLPATNLEGLAAGDVLLVQQAGAYLEAIANRFNGRRSVGLVVVDDDRSIQATRPEDPFLSPPVQTYDWGELSPPWPDAVALTSAEIAALRSAYFHDLASQDCSRLVAVQQISDSTYEFAVDTEAGVDFISVPFALRIAADAVIVAVLRAQGKLIKDVAVWSNKGHYTYHEPIEPGRRLAGQVSLSPVVASEPGRQRLLAAVTLDGGRFTLMAEVVV